MKILLVEDDDYLAQVVARHLKSQNYVVDVVADGRAGWSYASTFGYDLLILDLILPHLDGLSLCQRLRAEGDTTPILLLTAEDSKTIKIQALDTGADDYMVKPFDMAELVARIRVLLRRGQGKVSPLVAWGKLLLNTSSGEISYGDRPLSLTSKEYKFLELLLLSSSQVISMEEVLEYLWSADEFPVESTVRSHLRRLRHKLQQAGAPADLITTLHGRGYCLKPPSSESELSWPRPIQLDAHTTQSLPQLGPRSAKVALPETIHQETPEQYLAFLNRTWKTAQKACLEKITQLEQSPEGSLPLKPAALAHSLVGTLGLFGLTEAVALARQLETAWQQSGDDPRSDDYQKQLRQLRHWVEQTQTLDRCPDFSSRPLPGVWILSEDPSLEQTLTALATHRALQSRRFEDWQSILQALEQEHPACIIAQLEPLQALGDRPTQLASWRQALADVPLLILGSQDNLGDRRQALRLGGRFFLQPETSLDPVIAACIASEQRPLAFFPTPPQHSAPAWASPQKRIAVMVMDDDPHWLTWLLHQLQPQGFTVTTLADPSLFWQVLQSVQPDALILDVAMPDINGFELCQIVRGDPRWQALAILFLSILNDAESCRLAFAAGADDYLFKPVAVDELAFRIRSRLQRIQALRMT